MDTRAMLTRKSGECGAGVGKVSLCLRFIASYLQGSRGRERGCESHRVCSDCVQADWPDSFPFARARSWGMILDDG